MADAMDCAPNSATLWSPILIATGFAIHASAEALASLAWSSVMTGSVTLFLRVTLSGLLAKGLKHVLGFFDDIRHIDTSPLLTWRHIESGTIRVEL